MKDLKVKVITGYGGEGFTIDATESHKAYYLFLHPNERGIIGGIAIRGQDIMSIRPDWNASMGWNDGYKMQDIDYQETRPVQQCMAELLGEAKQSAEKLLPQEQFTQLLAEKKLLGTVQMKEFTEKYPLLASGT